MERYTVQITEDALRDMEDIYHYIAEAILTLDFLPLRCPLVQFEPERSAGLRRMLVDNYAVFYMVRENAVKVTNVLYSASDIEQRLKGTYS